VYLAMTYAMKHYGFCASVGFRNQVMRIDLCFWDIAFAEGAYYKRVTLYWEGCQHRLNIFSFDSSSHKKPIKDKRTI
jgi:hypothetical protein